MTYFDKHPQLFRVFFVIVAGALLAISASSIYRYASSPTDENVFRTSPSNLYITQSIPGEQIDLYDDAPKDSLPETENDSVKVGDLILIINNEFFDTAADIYNYLPDFDGAEELEITIFRPVLSRELTYLVSKKDIPDSSFRTIPSSVFVSDVTSKGASDRAGLKVGDLIYRINGQRFKDAGEADKILRFAQIGKSIAYEIYRNDQNLVLQITLANVGIRLAVLILIICGLIYMGTGIFVAIRRPHFPAARLMGFAFLALGFIMTAIMRRDILPDMFSIARDGLLTICILFSFSFILHMAHYFPTERPELINRKWIRYVSYGLASIFSLLTWIFDLRFTAIGFLLQSAFNLGIYLVFYRKCAKEYKYLNRTIRYTSAIVGAIIGGFFLYIYLSGTPAEQLNWALNTGLVGIPLILIPFAYLYTIGHYRLLNLDLRISRNIQYHTVTSIWEILILVMLVKLLLSLSSINFNLPNIQFKESFIEVVDTPMDPVHQAMMEKGMVIVLAIGIMLAIWRVRRGGKKLISTKFNRAEYDYRRAASELAEVMAAQFSMTALAEGIVKKLSSLMQVKQVGILFYRDEKMCCCTRVHGLPQDTWESFCVSVNEKIVELIQHNRSDYRFSVDYLPDDTREIFQGEGFRHIIAIRSKEKLVGVLLIGEKRSESPFHKDDLVFLAAVAKQASVAIENAFLYEELAEQQRLKHELEIARRIQIASLPQVTPRIEGLDIAGISIPAQEVGGDYFDYLNGVPNEVSDDITIIVGDVSGKGTSAALYMSKVQGIMRSLHDFGLSPRDLFIRANQLLFNDLEKTSFFTAVGAAFKSRQQCMVLARAGHSPVFYYQANTGQIQIIVPKGIGLGLTGSEKFGSELTEEMIRYEKGDVFVFITDGITEAHNISGEEFGEENVLNILQNHNGASAKRIRDQIISSVNHFTENARQHDDLTVVVVKAV
jgi:sigma-B regulation protein RsbU (phosphoserine phosphatase)